MAKIGMNVNYQEIPDSTSNVQMKSKGFVVGAGSILFDVTHGAMYSVSLELTGKMDVKDVIAGVTIPDVSVRQVIKLRGGF